MTKIGLVGQSYAARSVTMAAQVSMNLYGELIQDPNERGKNRWFLYGVPGRHVFKDLTAIDAAATPVRGIFTGAGRCFVAAGTKYFELSSTGTLIGSVRTISNATVFGFSNTPVYFLPNGNQLFIVSGGVGYIDNGSGPTAITIGASLGRVTAGAFGRVTSSGTAVTWVSGNKFLTDGSWVGLTISLDPGLFTILSVTDAEHLVLTATSGAAITGSYVVPDKSVTWFSGDEFVTDGTWVGKTIVVDSVSKVIASVIDSTHLLLTTAPTPTDGFDVAYSMAGYTPAFVTAAYLNDSFFANQANTRTANFSGVFRGDLWNGLDLISKDTWPDYVLAVLSNGNQVFLFGTDSFDVFQANPGFNGSTDNTAFTRLDGASCRMGIVSPWCPISIEGNIYFVGTGAQGGPIAYVLDGFTPKRISQHGQEAAWQANHLGPGCISYTETFEGHTFWVVNFLTETWAFDTTTGAWAQRSKGSGYTAWPFAYHSFIPQFGNGKHLVGGPADGTIYEMNPAFYDDAGTDIYWQRALPFLYNARNRMYDTRLELEMETGTAPSGTPVVSMDYSDDRGHTFSTPETASIGTTSAFSTRVFWSALGSYYERVYRFSGHGQGRVALIDCEIEQDLGTN